MSKILYFLISFVLVLSLAGNVLAQYDIMMWDNDEGFGDRMWDEPNNWMAPGKKVKIPEAPDWVELSEYYGDPCNGPIINGDMEPAVCDWIDMGYYTSGADVILTMEGGSLTVGLWLSMGYYQGGNYRLDITGGTIDVNYVYVGVYADSGTYTINMSGGVFNTHEYRKEMTDPGYLAIGTGRLCPQADMNMTGGYADVGWLEIGSWDTRTGKGHVDLHGGTLEADYLGMGGGGEGTMDFAGGTLIINGDYRVPTGWLFDPCSDTPLDFDEETSDPQRAFCSIDMPVASVDGQVLLDWDGYTGTIAILAKRGLITAYGAKVGDIITDSNYPSVVGLRAVIYPDYDVTNPGQTTITGGAVDPNLAWDPDPLHFSGGHLKGDVNLSWVAGDNAASHEVYLGTSFDDVNDATIDVNLGVYEGNQPLADVNYPVSITYGETYFWRIDEVNGPTTWKGTVWNFTTITASATNPRPTGTGVSPILLVFKWDPGPLVADVNGHYVYFSPDFNDVNDRDPNVLEILDTNNYAPGNLEFSTKYYWAVDEFNDLADPNIWPSTVLNFTTAAYLNVEKFNPYADTDALQAVWTIGHLFKNGAELQIETDTAHVNDVPSVLTGKSMLFAYRNTDSGGGTYRGSEAVADAVDLQAGTDWTYGGAEALVLLFQGDPCNAQEWLYIGDDYHILNDQMYVAVEDGDAVVGSGTVKYDTEHGYDMNDVTKTTWQKWNTRTTWQEWNIDLADPCLADVNMANVAKVYIGFGGAKTGQSGDGAGSLTGKFDTVYFDDIRLWPPRCVSVKVVADINGGDCITDYNDVDMMARDWLMYDYNVAAVAISSPPVGWWKLDEAKYATTADSSGYGNHGTIYNENWVGSYPDSPNDSALHLDGDGFAFYDRVICAERDGNGPGTYPAELMPATFTVACWVKVDSFDYFEGLVGAGTDWGWDECGFYLYSSGFSPSGSENENFGLMITTESAGLSFVETQNIYKPNIWYHLAATYNDANMVYIYVDGELIQSGSARGGSGPVPFGGPIRPTDVGGPIKWISDNGNYPPYFSIGAFPSGDNFNLATWYYGDATIDDVRVYGYAMPPGEIVTLAEQGPALYFKLVSPANISDDEPKTSKIVNFRDYRILADRWLEDLILWP